MLAASTRYALSALQRLAVEDGNSYIQVRLLCQPLGLPAPYVSKIIKSLARKDLVLTKKGVSGGVKLAPHSKNMSFLQVCEALGDPVIIPRCVLSRSACNAAALCSVHGQWSVIHAEILEFLSAARVGCPVTPECAFHLDSAATFLA